MRPNKKISEIISRNSRVCPIPIKWNTLWGKLNNKVQVGNGFQPTAPLILAAWDHSADIDKKHRLKEHIEWADKEGQLEEIFDFLENLTEEEWYHSGD